MSSSSAQKRNRRSQQLRRAGTGHSFRATSGTRSSAGSLKSVLNNAGLVCASWHRLAVEEPMLWRHIDIAFDWEAHVGFAYDQDPDYFNAQETPPWLLAMTRAAVDRSAGRCESFCGPVDCNLLLHLATSSPSLRSLHITSFFRLHKELVGKVVPKLATLERLVLPRGLLTPTTLGAFIDHCPRLEMLDAGGCYLGYWSVVRAQGSHDTKTAASQRHIL
ncbi:hypothetical protein QOZ80_1BG0050140 [Eleusine coracana subsp. coracana]|nr:hypothetical protein QOZ80_1BG0050140 [Eleusine coracana subsp. coracana]